MSTEATTSTEKPARTHEELGVIALSNALTITDYGLAAALVELGVSVSGTIDGEPLCFGFADSKKTIAWLQKRGADLSGKNAEGDTLFHVAVRREQNPAIALAALEGGVDVNAVGSFGHTCAVELALYDRPEFDAVWSALLQKRPRLDVPSANGDTALLICARRGGVNGRLRQILGCDLDVNINQADADGNTALHYRVAQTAVTEVQALLDAGADPTIRNREGDRPLDWLATSPHSDKDQVRALLIEALAPYADARAESLTPVPPAKPARKKPSL